jgi:hypothetical protein
VILNEKKTNGFAKTSYCKMELPFAFGDFARIGVCGDTLYREGDTAYKRKYEKTSAAGNFRYGKRYSAI